MPWLVRFGPLTVDEPTTVSAGPLDRDPLLVSGLWDLGCGGVAEHGQDVIAGFERLEDARRAAELGARHRRAVSIEAAEETWTRTDPVEVSVATLDGAVVFPVVAGRAFGHGGHPTTRLCLELMAGSGRLPGSRLLDLGTGSGVLAVAACHLGAAAVTASDIDQSAVDTARFNAAANDVDIDVVWGDVDHLLGSHRQPDQRFDVVVANVLVTVHEQVAAAVCRLLAPGGTLIVAGFLVAQTDRTEAAYQRHRPTLTVTTSIDRDEWRGLLMLDTAPTGEFLQ